MERDQDMERHLLGDSLLASLDLEICGHEGHMPFSFESSIRTGQTSKIQNIGQFCKLCICFIGFNKNAVYLTGTGIKLCAKEGF